jgi:glycosyltransferase involved in cell wall biosynthesis
MMIPPAVSVIIPAYNAEKSIIQNLSALAEQKCAFGFEIIVVDDGSTDRTRDLVEEFNENSGSSVGVRLVKASHRGPAAARNIGVKEARSDTVLFIDADCIVQEEWLSSMVEQLFADASIAGVGGTYTTLNRESPTARFVGYDIAYRHARLNKPIDHLGTYSAAFRKKALLDVGLFDETFAQADSEDNDVSYRLVERGYRLAFQPKAVVSHPHPSKVRLFLQKQFRRAYWRTALYAKHPQKLKEPDWYTSWHTQLQPFVWLFPAVLTLPLVWLNALLVPPLLILTVIIILSLNGGLLKRVYLEEKSLRFLIFSSALCVLRSLVWALGGFFGALRFGGRLKSRQSVQ